MTRAPHNVEEEGEEGEEEADEPPPPKKKETTKAVAREKSRVNAARNSALREPSHGLQTSLLRS